METAHGTPLSMETVPPQNVGTFGLLRAGRPAPDHPVVPRAVAAPRAAGRAVRVNRVSLVRRTASLASSSVGAPPA